MKKIIIPLIILIAAVGALLAGATPSVVRYQGSLLYHGLAFTGTQTMRFMITNSDGSVSYWDSQDVPVNVTNGSFSYAMNVSGVNWNTPPSGGFFLQISVNDQLLLPREQVGSNIYSLQAQNVDDGAISMQKLSAAVQAKINTSTGGDNLGNHIATTTLNMSNFNIANAATVYANKVAVSTFTMATGAIGGYVLTCDSAGNGFWQLASSAAISGLLSSANVWTGAQTYNSATNFGNEIGMNDNNIVDVSTVAFAEGELITTYPLASPAGGNIWIPANDLDMGGNSILDISNITAASVQIASGTYQQSGWVLTTDGSGNGTWAPGSGTNLLPLNNTWTGTNTWTSSGTFLNNVGITGKAMVGSLAMPTGASAGYVLTSADNSGNAVWTANTPGTNLLVATNTWTAPNTWSSTGTYNNTQYFVKGINTSTITITAGSLIAGNVLTTDINGNGSWKPIPGSTNLLVATNTWTAPNTWNSTGTYNNTQYFTSGINTSSITITGGANSGYILTSNSSGYATWSAMVSSSTYAVNAGTASWSVSAGTAAYTSYAVNAGTSAWTTNTGTSTWATNAGELSGNTASYFATATGLQAVANSTYSQTAISISTGQVTGSWAPNLIQAGTLNPSVVVGTASWSVNAGTAAYTTYAVNSGTSTYANYAVNSGTSAYSAYAVNSGTTSWAVNAGTAAYASNATGSLLLEMTNLSISTGAIAAQLAGIYGTTSTWTASQVYGSTMAFNGEVNMNNVVNVTTISLTEGELITSYEIPGGGNIEIPANDLDMNGNNVINVSSITADNIQILTSRGITIPGGQAGYVLTEDGNGNGYWAQAASTGGVLTAILSSTNTWTAPQTFNSSTTMNNSLTVSGNVGIGTANPESTLDVNGAVSAALGSASAPAYSFEGDLNTGIYSTGADSLSVATGGAERMRIYSNGNMALDDFTNLPGAAGNSTYKVLHFASPTSGGSTIISMASRNLHTSFFGDSGNNFIIGTEGANPIIFKNGLVYGNSDTLNSGSETMRIDTNGSVGIGTASPGQLLQVGDALDGTTGGVVRRILVSAHGGSTGSSGIQLGIYNNNYTAEIVNEDVAANGVGLAFRNANNSATPTTKMLIDRNGNVGIGTTSPNYNLDVAGNGNFSGGVIVSSITIGSQSAIIATDSTGENIQFETDLDMNNNQILNVADLQIPTGAQNGYVLMSDSSGYASWQSVTSTSGVLTAILSSTNTWTAPQTFSATTTINSSLAVSGNVGIGTVTPASIVNISGNTPLIRIDDTYPNSAARNWGICNDYEQTPYGTLGFMVSSTQGGTPSATPLVVFSPSGNVGIGTTGPVKLLQVSGSATGMLTNLKLTNTHDTDGDATGIQFGTNNPDSYTKGGIYWERTGTFGVGSLMLAVNTAADSSNVSLSDAKLTINSNGNVGIGTTSPNYNLDVAGNGNFSGGVTVSSVTVGPQGATITTDSTGENIQLPDNDLDMNGNQILNISDLQIPTGAQNGYVLMSDSSGYASWQSVTSTSGVLTAILSSTNTWTASQTFTSSMTVNSGVSNSVLGIGSWNDPSKLWDIINNNGFFSILGAGANATVFSVGSNNTPLMTISNGGLGIGSSYAGSYATYPPPANGLIVQGDVGVGTASPSAKLDIGAGGKLHITNDSGDSNTGIGFWNDVNFYRYGALPVGLRTNSNLYVDGNVGIGTASPGYTLDVAGNGNFSGGVTVSSVTVGSQGAVITTDATGENIQLPTNDLDMNGNNILNVENIQIASATAVNGYVLTSDAEGNGSWQSVGTNLLNTANTWTAQQTYNSNAILANNVGLLGKQTGGTTNQLIKMSSDNRVFIGDENQVVDIVILGTSAKPINVNGSRITSLADGTGSTDAVAKEQLDAVAMSTGAIQSQLTSVANSTYTMASISISTGQVTGSWAPNLMQAGVLNPSVTVGTAAWATNAGELGGNLASYYTNPANMSAGVLPSTVIASSIAVNSVYPSAVNTGTYSNITLPAANVAAGSLGASVMVSSIAANAVYPSGIASGTLPSNVIASSIAVNSVYPAAVLSGTYSNITVPAANVASGSLGASVIASSIAVNSVYPSAVSAGTYSNVIVSSLTTGTYSNVSIPAANVNAGSLGSSVIVSSISNTTNPTLAGLTNTGNENISGTLTVTSSATFNNNAFSVGGSTFVVTNGLVGVGTTSPTTTFTVANSAGAVTQSVIAAANSQARIDFYDGGTDKFQIGKNGNWDVSNGFFIYDVTGSRYILEAAQNGSLSLMPGAGNVGIGTTSPGARLEVDGNITSTGTVTDAGETVTGSILVNNNQALQFKDSGGTARYWSRLDSSNNFILGDLSIGSGSTYIEGVGTLYLYSNGTQAGYFDTSHNLTVNGAISSGGAVNMNSHKIQNVDISGTGLTHAAEAGVVSVNATTFTTTFAVPYPNQYFWAIVMVEQTDQNNGWGNYGEVHLYAYAHNTSALQAFYISAASTNISGASVSNSGGNIMITWTTSVSNSGAISGEAVMFYSEAGFY